MGDLGLVPRPVAGSVDELREGATSAGPLELLGAAPPLVRSVLVLGAVVP